ncbi:MAG: M48 family metallopeptidase [Chromatiales bacterium]
MRDLLLRLLAVAGAVCAIAACATSPLGHSQLRLFSDDQMAQMGIAAFQEMKTQTPPARDAGVNRYVTCVANAITREVSGGNWEVQVFKQDDPNAFALPGGKIGVHTGMLKAARNQHQLAAVIGHEVAHVLARHSNARVSSAYAAQAGLAAADVLTGAPSPQKQQLLALLGLGTQVGVLLPYGRAQESEADLMGLDLMAGAGFDPRESVNLWNNMARLGGGRPPEFLSTHPSGQTRINDLTNRMPYALSLFKQARAQGKRPNCS